MLIAQTEAEELPTVTVNPYFSFDPVTKTVSEMKQHLNEFSNEELVKTAKTGERVATENLFLMKIAEKWEPITTTAMLTHVFPFLFLVVNKMPFCELDESKKRRSVKS